MSDKKRHISSKSENLRRQLELENVETSHPSQVSVADTPTPKPPHYKVLYDYGPMPVGRYGEIMQIWTPPKKYYVLDRRCPAVENEKEYEESTVLDTPHTTPGAGVDVDKLHALYAGICERNDGVLIPAPSKARQRDVGKVKNTAPWTYGQIVEIRRRLFWHDRVDWGLADFDSCDNPNFDPVCSAMHLCGVVKKLYCRICRVV